MLTRSEESVIASVANVHELARDFRCAQHDRM